MTPPESPRIWVLADPRAGTAAQALGIAERLGEPFRRVDLAWGKLARLPLPFASLAGMTPEARPAFAPPCLHWSYRQGGAAPRWRFG